MKIKELLHKAEYKDLSEEIWHSIYKEISCFIEDMKTAHKEKVEHLEKDIEELVCYTPLSMEEAKHFVKQLKNNDGTEALIGAKMKFVKLLRPIQFFLNSHSKMFMRL